MKKFSRIYTFTLLALLYAPVLALIVFSFTDSPVFGKWSGFSLDLYKGLFSNAVPEISSALAASLWVMALVTIGCVVLGTTAAIGYHYNRSRTVKKLVCNVNNISLANPDIVAAVSLFLLYTSLGTTRGPFTVILSQIAVYTPFVFMNVLPVLQKMDSNIYDASADLGASMWMTLFRVILPQAKSGIISGGVIAAILSLDDYAVSLFSRGNGGFETLSTYIYADARRGSLTPEFRALYSILIVILLVIFFVRRKKVLK